MRLPWRLTHLGGFSNTVLGVHLRRPLLRWRLRALADQPDDITVILGHRDRADHRPRNALRSLREQQFPGRIHVLIVDYGSTPAQLAAIEAIAAEHHAEVVAVAAAGRWNRSHCLNIGLRRTTTKFVMISDIDVLLAPNYLASAVHELQRDPLAAWFSKCLHLPDTVTAELRSAAAGDTRLDLASLKRHGVVKTRDAFSTGMVTSYTLFFELIRGYDEFYHTYGAEDSDLAQRFLQLGLRAGSLDDRTFYLHQWHPRHEGVESVVLDQALERNTAHLKTARSLKRNPGGWGTAIHRSPTDPT